MSTVHLQRRGDRLIETPAIHDGDNQIGIERYFTDVSRLGANVHLWHFEPGSSEGAHVHEDSEALDELYLVVAGELVMTVNGERTVLRAGDSVYAEAQTDHGIANESDAPADLVLVWGPQFAGELPGRSGQVTR